MVAFRRSFRPTHQRVASHQAMTDDNRSSASTKIELPHFPGEVVLAHEGLMWKIAASATVKLAPHELVVVAETGIQPAANAIIDVDIDIDDFPAGTSHQPPDYERRKSERKRIENQNASNVAAFTNHAATVDDAVRGLAKLLREKGAVPRARPLRNVCTGACWHRRGVL